MATPDKLINEPMTKDNKELFECILMENPVCKPITETNRDVPSFENVFNVPWAFMIISLLSFEVSLFIKKPMIIDANKIPAMSNEIPFIRILPMAKPAIIMKYRRLSGEAIILKRSIIHHRIAEYEEGESHETSFELCRFVCQYGSVHRTTPHI